MATRRWGSYRRESRPDGRMSNWLASFHGVFGKEMDVSLLFLACIGHRLDGITVRRDHIRLDEKI